MSNGARWLVGAVVAAISVLATPAAAWAHAELLSSDPAYGDRLPAAPREMRLDFSAPMDLTGARLVLQRAGGRPLVLAQGSLGSADRRVVVVPLPDRLGAGEYSVIWLFLGSDGQLMSGEVPFIIGAPAPATGAPPAPVPPSRDAPATEVRTLGPGIAGPALAVRAGEPRPSTRKRSSGPARSAVSVATPQAVVRFLDYVSLAVLLGGGFFLARVWSDGAGVPRAQRLLWAALGVSVLATLLTFGLTAAGLRGLGALDALRPSVMSAALGTHLARVLTARACFLALAVGVLGMLSLGRERAARSRWWQGLAAVTAGGLLTTYALLGHASGAGLLGRVAVLVHLVGVTIWLGGLIVLTAVVLPRRRSAELRTVMPRFSRLAFGAVSAMVLAGAVMLIRVVPHLSRLPGTGYGRILLLKLALVAFLLAAAQQARTFTQRRLALVVGVPGVSPEETGDGGTARLRPLLLAVGVELTLAVVILSSTAVLVGRAPPATRTNRVATPSVAATNAASFVKGR